MVRLFTRIAMIAADAIVTMSTLSAQSLQATNHYGHHKACELAGTWYGGSDMTTPYQFTAVPIGEGRYSLRFQQAVDYLSLGIRWVTDWTGEATRVRDGYRVSAMSFAVDGPEAAAQLGGSLEMDAVLSTFTFSDDCNTITNTIDTFIAYIPWTEEKVPFVTDPDYNWLEIIGIDTLVEQYHRFISPGVNGRYYSHGKSLQRPNGMRLRGETR